MKKIIISDDRKLNISNIVVGYLQENKIEKLEFEIPKEYENFGRKACFLANGNTFTKTFDNIKGNTITLTRDITQYQDLFMTIAFFKIEDEDEIIARTSTLHILIQDAVICDDDIKPDDPKVVILDNLITKVTNLDNTVTKNEEIREDNETTRQQNETNREENEINRVNSEANREKAEESRKKAELERVSNENARQSNEEERKAAENERLSNENAREEYINNLKAQVDNGDFDGADFNYKWDGTKLGVKNSKETTYQFVELKGQKGDKGGKGDKGDTGNGIQTIEKVSTVGNVDTYAINYTDGTQTTFDVTNGEVTKEQLDEVDNKVKNTRNELERVKNDVLETGTDTDTYIHLEDSAWSEMQEVSIDGVCEQNTTTGKNLCNLNVVQDSRVVYNPDGTITINGEGGFSLKFSGYAFKVNTTYYMKWELVSGSVNQENIFMIPNNTFFPKKDTFSPFKFDSDTVANGFWIHGGALFTNAIIRIWFSETQDSFEPYTGGQPSPSPDFSQEIKTLTGNLKLTSCGKNLFDINNLNFENVWVKPTGEKIAANNNGFLSYVEILPNAEYILSLNKSVSSIGICEYDKNKNFIQRIVVSNSSSKTIITSTTTKYIGVFINIDGTTLVTKDIIDECEPQLEKSNQATPYEPYQGSSLNIAIPSNEFVGKLDDTYKDTLNVVYKDDGHYHLILNKMIGKVVLNGSENWQLSSYTNDIICSAYAAISNYLNGLLISDLFSYQNNVNATTTTEYVATGGDSIRIGVLKSRLNASTIDDFKSWLSTHNTEVCYPLKTPYEVDLGVVDTLLSYDKITNLFTDSDLLPTINAKYYRNFISTVRNLQVNEKALKQELVDINNRLTALENANVVDNNPTEESEATNDIQVQ